MPEPEVDERMYEMYLSYCRAHEQRPSLKDFRVWLSEAGYDEDEPDWAGYVRVEG